MSEHLTLESLADRLQCVESANRRLELQNRRLRSVAVLAVAATLAAVCMGQLAKPKTVEAERFVLRDAEGKVRGQLRAAEQEAAFELYDAEGTKRIDLGIAAAYPRLSLSDAEGRARMSLVASQNEPNLALRDESGRERMRLSVSETDTNVALYGADQAGHAAELNLYTYKDKASYILISDQDSHNRAVFGLFEEGPRIKLMDVEASRALWSAP